MNWNEAFKLMKQGNKIKLPSWAGYWYWDQKVQTIMMHCKDCETVDIRDTKVVDYTFSNIASDEWVVASKENTPILGGEATFNFEEALKYLKRGLKICRKGWNGKGLYIELEKGGNYKFSEILPYFVIKNTQNSFNTWVPSVSDLMAEDWMFYEEENK